MREPGPKALKGNLRRVLPVWVGLGCWACFLADNTLRVKFADPVSHAPRAINYQY